MAALDAAADVRLTLVSGAPGSGKSVLLSDWAARQGVPFVALDASAQTAAGLWAGLSAALGPVGRTRPAPPSAPADVAARLLAHPAASAPALAIDDVHLADSPSTRATLTALLRAPGAPRLILGTRVDPGVALQRLRLAGDLAEIRGSDLAFTLDEATALLQREGAALDAVLVQRLWERTEGWAAGLRLAGLALEGHPDPAGFVQDFAGDDRAIVAYLIEEVLERQSDAARELLLATAVVDRVSPELADALTGRSDGAVILDDLLRRNAFVVPLDRRGEWYRYHALFAELLRSQLARSGRAAVARQHRKAARWLAADGQPAQALAHAVQAEDWDAATTTLAHDWLALRGDDDGGAAALDAALAAFPDAALRARPHATLVAALRAADRGDRHQADRHLAVAGDARHRLGGARRTAFARDLSLVRLVRAAGDGDVAAGLRELPVAVSLEREPAARDRAAAALAHLEVGRLLTADGDDAAERHLRLAQELAEEAAHPELAAEAGAERALLYAMGGELGAARLAGDAVASTVRPRGPAPLAALLAGAVCGTETGDLDSAGRRLEQARDLLVAGGAGRGRLRALELAVAAGRRALLDGPATARAATQQLQDALAGWAAPARVDVEARATLAALLVRNGRPAEALTLLDNAPAGDALVAPRGTALVALGRSDAALAEADAAWAGAPGASGPAAVALATVAATAAEAEGDRGAAQRHAERALDLAEPEGLRLALAVAVDGLEPILRRLLRLGTAHRSLIGEVLELGRSGAGTPGADVTPLDEPLSDRELTVLRYLPTMLSSGEIAAELFVTVNTVKSHLKSIYRKLGVRNRREAVERARDLGLVAVSSLSLERRPADGAARGAGA